MTLDTAATGEWGLIGRVENHDFIGLTFASALSDDGR